MLLLRWMSVVGMLAQDPSIVAAGAKLERLVGDGFFTEGPAQAPDGSVYFSDITFVKTSGYQAGHIWRWDPRTATTAVFRSPSGMPNGIVFDAQGRMVVAEGAGFGSSPGEGAGARMRRRCSSLRGRVCTGFGWSGPDIRGSPAF